jgi:hypothetical protein
MVIGATPETDLQFCGWPTSFYKKLNFKAGLLFGLCAD